MLLRSTSILCRAAARSSPRLTSPAFGNGRALFSTSTGGKDDDAEKRAEEAEKERIAREIVYGEGGKPPPMPYKLMFFTAFVFGTYIAYVKFIEEPMDAQKALEWRGGQPATVERAPLPAGAAKRLPDGRVLMQNGSIQPAPPPPSG